MPDSEKHKQRGKVAHLRIPEDVHAELVAYAARTDRSLNGAAIYAIRQFLASDRASRTPSSDPLPGESPTR